MTTNSRSTNLTNDDVTVHYRYISADGVHVFYRKAGDPKAPTILLLHGFPIAPDLPGFGFTEVPQKRGYIYIFEDAEAYKRDNANATIELLDTGHFALETHAHYTYC